MLLRKRYWFMLPALAILIVFAILATDLPDYIRYEFSNKNTLKINLSAVNEGLRSVAADPANKVLLKVEVRSKAGEPVPKAKINVTTNRALGTVSPSGIRTNNDGEALLYYIPPVFNKENFPKGNTDLVINAKLSNSNVSSLLQIKLIRNPIAYIHGYQANGNIFSSMNEVFSSKGYDGLTFNYDSKKGVSAAAKGLSDFLKEHQMHYLSQGIQVKKFDLVTHSMGGLVARYYTTSQRYILNNNIRKIIFISVPHKGSPWAPIGAKYFDDQGVRDLIPDNPLITQELPGMLNEGLNKTIQVGNIIGQYDEVVSQESAALNEWGIKTEIFAVGKSSLDLNNLLNGNITEAANHRSMVSNKKVFERILQMLEAELPYPEAK